MEIHVEQKRSGILCIYLKFFDCSDIASVNIEELVVYHSVEQLKVDFSFIFDLFKYP